MHADTGLYVQVAAISLPLTKQVTIGRDLTSQHVQNWHHVKETIKKSGF